jgi:hypothetical protein
MPGPPILRVGASTLIEMRKDRVSGTVGIDRHVAGYPLLDSVLPRPQTATLGTTLGHLVHGSAESIDGLPRIKRPVGEESS